MDDPDFSVIHEDKSEGDHCVVTHHPSEKEINVVRKGNHCVHKPKMATAFVNAVAENKAMHSKKQQAQACKAKLLMESLMMPNMKSLRKAIMTDQIKNCPMTDAECQLALEICGKSVPNLKGKSTNTTSTPAVTTVVDVPKKVSCIHRNVHLCVDIMCVNGLSFLVSISGDIMCRSAEHPVTKEAITVHKAMVNVFAKCNNAGHRIRHISCDNQFGSVFDPINTPLKVTMHHCAAQEHNPVAERNVRSIKDQTRSAHAAHPFTHSPTLLTIQMVSQVTR